MQANRRAKTRAGSTLAAFALAAVAAAAVAYAVSRRQSKQQELEEESKASERSETAAENPATPTRRASRPSHDNPEAQTPEWLRTACTALARHAVPSPARAVQGLSDRLDGARDPPEGASSGGNHPVQHSIREEESEVVDREVDPVEEGAQQQVRLPTGVALTAALFGVVVAWVWNGTLWSDLAYGRLGWLYGFLVSHLETFCAWAGGPNRRRRARRHHRQPARAAGARVRECCGGADGEGGSASAMAAPVRARARVGRVRGGRVAG